MNACEKMQRLHMRYALKWEVAFLVITSERFFHGVCPILNRAKSVRSSKRDISEPFELLRLAICRFRGGS